MSVNVLYKTQAKATGGRDGHAATLDGALDVKLTTPKELGGGGGAGNNPEQLFAAGYAACFIGAMKFVSSQGGPKVPADASVTSTVGIGRVRKAVSVSTSRWKSRCRGWRARTPRRWSPRPIRCAPIPTPRVVTSMFASRSCSAARPARKTGRPIAHLRGWAAADPPRRRS